MGRHVLLQRAGAWAYAAIWQIWAAILYIYYPCFVAGHLHNSLIYLPDSTKLSGISHIGSFYASQGGAILLDLIYDRSNIFPRASVKACISLKREIWHWPGRAALMLVMPSD